MRRECRIYSSLEEEKLQILKEALADLGWEIDKEGEHLVMNARGCVYLPIQRIKPKPQEEKKMTAKAKVLFIAIIVLFFLSQFIFPTGYIHLKR